MSYLIKMCIGTAIVTGLYLQSFYVSKFINSILLSVVIAHHKSYYSLMCMGVIALAIKF